MTIAAPGQPGIRISELDTPALVIDLDSFERNLALMAKTVSELGIKFRPHSKTHKSPVIARMQMDLGAVGVCCQKISEAEILVEGGITDILISNEVVGTYKVKRLAELAGKARIGVCVDDAANIKEIAHVANALGVVVTVLVEIDVGAQRCGVLPGEPALRLAEIVANSSSLKFGGLQAYHGGAQHIREHAARRLEISCAIEKTRHTVDLLAHNGLTCDTITGAGTGTFMLEGESGVYNELQAGSYVFMDADYAQNFNERDKVFDTFEHSLFILSTVMSHPNPARSILDAGHKAASVDAGMPTLFGQPDISYGGPSDEHGVLTVNRDAKVHLPELGGKVLLIPGHCDPTVNLHDWFIGIRGMHTKDAHVESVWPVAARGAYF